MAQIFEATIVYIEQAVEELSSSPLYIRKLAESLTFRDFIQFLSTGAPHITAPIPEEGVQTCAAQTKKLEDEKKAKGREAPIDDRPESSKRRKVRHTDKATSLEEQRKFFSLQAKVSKYNLLKTNKDAHKLRRVAPACSQHLVRRRALAMGVQAAALRETPSSLTSMIMTEKRPS